MSNQNSVIVMFLVLLVVALLEGNMLNTVMVITMGFVTLAIPHYGGERLRRFLRRLLLKDEGF